MGRAPYSTHKILYKRLGFRAANFSSADFHSAKFRFADFSRAGLRSLQLGLLSLSLAFLGNCGGCGSSNGNGGSAGGDGNGNGDKPTCTGSEILKNDQCEACPDPQFPNADRTACVTQLPHDGEIKLEGKPTCEDSSHMHGR